MPFLCFHAIKLRITTCILCMTTKQIRIWPCFLTVTCKCPLNAKDVIVILKQTFLFPLFAQTICMQSILSKNVFLCNSSGNSSNIFWCHGSKNNVRILIWKQKRCLDYCVCIQFYTFSCSLCIGRLYIIESCEFF